MVGVAVHFRGRASGQFEPQQVVDWVKDGNHPSRPERPLWRQEAARRFELAFRHELDGPQACREHSAGTQAKDSSASSPSLKRWNGITDKPPTKKRNGRILTFKCHTTQQERLLGLPRRHPCLKRRRFIGF